MSMNIIECGKQYDNLFDLTFGMNLMSTQPFSGFLSIFKVKYLQRYKDVNVC